MKRDDATRLVDDGIAELNGALACGRSETLKHYLAVMSRFHRYSFGNLMLILSQREDAIQRTAAALIEELDAVERCSDHTETSGWDALSTTIDPPHQEAAA